MPASIQIAVNVVKEILLDGTILGIHILPAKTMHLVMADECWCKPTMSTKLADELYAYPGAKIWIHHFYQVRRG